MASAITVGRFPGRRLRVQRLILLNWRGLEYFAQPPLHFRELVRGQAAQHPVVGEHQQAWVFESNQRHHYEVAGVAWTDFACVQLFLLELQGRMVAVMSVGQEDRLVLEEAGDRAGEGRVGDLPQGCPQFVAVVGVQIRGPGHDFLEYGTQGAAGVAVEAHDGADVGVARFHQGHPVTHGRGLGVLVGQHLPAVVRLQADAGGQPQTSPLPSLMAKHLP